MFNHFKRNLSILNKDAVETSWLKCLIDDVPKQKHLLILTKCLNGDYTNINPNEALRKITQRMNHPQKVVNSLKTFYLVHLLQEHLLPWITDKTIEQSTKNSADAVLVNVAHLYFLYLKSFSSPFEQINVLFKMHRQLEILILKLDIPILQYIASRLVVDSIALFDKILQSDDQVKKVRATKQIKRFLEIKKYVQLQEEVLIKINSLRFDEIIMSSQPLQNNFISNLKPVQKPPSKQLLTLNLSLIRDNKMQTSQNEQEDNEQKTIQETHLHKSLQPSPNRVRYATKTPNRAISIRDNFFVPQQGPLSFIMMS